MCGISGFDLTPDGAAYVDRRALATELFKAIEPRGGHAAGLAWYGKGGGLGVQKQPGKSSNLAQFNFGDKVETAIFHTRFATQGAPEVNRNNHPLISHTPEGLMVAGIHNGCLDNDAELTKTHNLARYAVTDSDAIFALMAVKGTDSPVALEEVRGSMAIAYVVEGTDTLYVAKGDSSPVYFYQTSAGVVFSSVGVLSIVQEFLEVAKEDVEVVYMAEGQWCSVKGGLTDTVESFQVAERWTRRSWTTGVNTTGVSSNYYRPYKATTQQVSVGRTFQATIDGDLDEVCNECLGFVNDHDMMCSENPFNIESEESEGAVYGGVMTVTPDECPKCGCSDLGSTKFNDSTEYFWCRDTITKCTWYATLRSEVNAAAGLLTSDEAMRQIAVKALANPTVGHFTICVECNGVLGSTESFASGVCSPCRTDADYPQCQKCGYVLAFRNLPAGSLCTYCEGS